VSATQSVTGPIGQSVNSGPSLSCTLITWM
jgi:hypothetical protein